VGDEEVPGALVSDRGDFDELCKAVANLGLGECLKEGKVKEGGEWGVVGAKAVKKKMSLRENE
jgi:hypothetical protein